MNAPAVPVCIESLVADAQKGNTESLNIILANIQKQIYAISMRFLANPHDAEDASQEIIIRIIKNINSFKGDSLFRTWAYRVACNTLISIKNQKKDERTMSFEEFAEGMSYGMDDNFDRSEQDNPDYQRLLEEIRSACTLAMLQCLDEDSRLAYIVGEIFEMDHLEAGIILNISTDKYRKRLSRARQRIVKFMSDNCGLVNEQNRCRCDKQVTKCLAKGCVSRDNLQFSKDAESAIRFPDTLKYIRSLDEAQRAASLFRQIPTVDKSDNLNAWLKVAMTELQNIAHC